MRIQAEFSQFTESAGKGQAAPGKRADQRQRGGVARGLQQFQPFCLDFSQNVRHQPELYGKRVEKR